MLSIIIPARNDAALTARCVRSALHSVDSHHLRCQFVLVDDASEADEGILPIFQQYRASTRNHEFIIVRADRHQHYTGVFCIGLHLANRANILFLSNDMLITPTFFVALLALPP